jgi:hypothetical protein
VARDTDVVPVRDHLRPDGDVGAVRRDHLTGEIDAGDQRIDTGDSAGLAAGEAVLEVDARPADPDEHLAVGEGAEVDLFDPARPTLIGRTDDEGAGGVHAVAPSIESKG